MNTEQQKLDTIFANNPILLKLCAQTDTPAGRGAAKLVARILDSNTHADNEALAREFPEFIFVTTPYHGFRKIYGLEGKKEN